MRSRQFLINLHIVVLRIKRAVYPSGLSVEMIAGARAYHIKDLSVLPVCDRIDDLCTFPFNKRGRIVWAKRQRQFLRSPPSVKGAYLDHVSFRLEGSGAMRWGESGQSKDCVSKVAVVGCGCGGVEDETAREGLGLVRLQVSRRNLRLSRSTMLLGY